MKNDKHKKLRNIGHFIFEVFYNAALIIVLVVVLRGYIVSPFRVVGGSMNDTLVNGELILIDKISYILGEPDRGDVIVFLPPVTGRDRAKFELDVTTNGQGQALQLDALRATKQGSYCQKNILNHFWFCKEGVKEGDLLYYLPSSPSTEITGFNWKNTKQRYISAEEIEKNTLIFDDPDQSYRVKIYNITGADYFVKRIIGLPGDTIKFETEGDEGLVYLKKAGETEFKKIEEPYLNEINKNATYLPGQLNENTFLVPEGKYFGMGDNRGYSNDGRSFFAPDTQIHTPYIPKDQISGRVMMVLLPLWNIKWIGGQDL